MTFGNDKITTYQKDNITDIQWPINNLKGILIINDNQTKCAGACRESCKWTRAAATASRIIISTVTTVTTTTTNNTNNNNINTYIAKHTNTT